MSWSGLGIRCAFLLLAVPFIVAKPSFPLLSQGLLSIFLQKVPILAVSGALLQCHHPASESFPCACCLALSGPDAILKMVK